MNNPCINMYFIVILKKKEKIDENQERLVIYVIGRLGGPYREKL